MKLVGGQISDQCFMLACLSDSTWISEKLIVMQTDKKISRKTDGKLDPFQPLLLQFKAYRLSFSNFKRIFLSAFQYVRKKMQQKAFSLVSYLRHKHNNR